MTSPAQPTGEERAETMSLERQVAAIIGNGMVTRESPLSIAHHAVALVREQIVALLSEVYTDDGVAMALTGCNVHVSPDVPLIEVCRTAECRARVLAWAESLAEGNFS